MCGFFIFTLKVMNEDLKFMLEAIDESIKGIEGNEGGPFGAVVVKDGKIIGRGHNRVTSTNDPTAHAEIIAIREACKNMNSFQLNGCIVYSSCEPCPMCLGAIYWARPDKVFYANTREDAANIGFDDSLIYNEISLPLQERKISYEKIKTKLANDVFQQWIKKENKINY